MSTLERVPVDANQHRLMFGPPIGFPGDATRYPQAPPFSNVSAYLAELVVGEHDLRAFDSHRGPAWVAPFQSHAEYAISIVTLYNTAMQLGIMEHSGDWDWGTAITLRDGTVVGDYMWADPDAYDKQEADPAYEVHYCDDLLLPTTPPIDFNIGTFSGAPEDVTVTVVLHDDEAGDVPNRTFAVKDIAIIHISQR